MILMANPGAAAPLNALGEGYLNLREPAMSRKRLFFVPKTYFTEYLFSSVIGRKDTLSGNTPYHKPSEKQAHADISAVHRDSVTEQNFTKELSGSALEMSPLSPELTDYLLGKAPLRLIVAREEVKHQPHEHVPEYLVTYYQETLECGHLYVAHGPDFNFAAKRRRCVPCKKMLGKKPSQSVGRNQEKKIA